MGSSDVAAATGCASSGVPGLAAHRVQGFGGGPAHDVEGARAPHRVEAAFTDHRLDPVSSVGRDVSDRRAAVLTDRRARGCQCVEEAVQRGLVLTRRRPDKAAGVVVDHHNQVAVTLVGDFIDPDSPQPGEPVLDGIDVISNPGDDRTDGSPGDPHQLGHRGLGALGGQPSDLGVEGTGVAGGMASPRHRPHGRAVLAAVHSRGIGLKPDRDSAQAQGPPAAPTLTVVIVRCTT